MSERNLHAKAFDEGTQEKLKSIASICESGCLSFYMQSCGCQGFRYLISLQVQELM